ncbi:HAD hydrolase-like protein [Novosphingobium sediminicola]|uniref:phosphoglycolate phosphatase n=1 Tax=Novosphingobium sediminicola TaxID=563162 RepID=A0A7W6G822_9SPHN|nr:HAD hydrolase-like protein [Novosphingobium sediminicola]MBB3956906.1 phosphoglycolate phosphatase [Novosphingobium sediminicola]
MHNFPFDIVGFDLDGTLLDTKLDLGVALNHALEQGGFAAVPLDMIPRLVGGGTRVLMERALAVQGATLDDDGLTAMAAELVRYYDANIAVHSRLFPGGAEMLDDLAGRGVRLAVVTNKMEHLARKLFGELGLTERFYTIIGGDTLGPGRQKPLPDLLHLMVERSGMASPRTAYIGDTHFDTGAAQAANIPCVVCSFGFNQGRTEHLGADAVIDHFDALVPALEQLGGK